MNWILPDPDPTGLPAAVWLLQALLVFTFVLHVIVMNVALGGGVTIAFAGWRARLARSADAAERHRVLASSLARLLPVSMAFAITTGVAPLLFLQVLYGQLFYSSSVLMAWWWLLVVPLLLVAYYGYYGVSHLVRQSGDIPRLAVRLAVASAVLMVVIAFIFTNNMTLMLRPDRFGAMYGASDLGLHLDTGDRWIWPRLLHILVGAMAVTGLTIGLVGRWRQRRDLPHGEWMAVAGTRLFIGATLVQFAVGAWQFLWLPPMVEKIFLQGGPETMVLASGIAFAVIAMISAPQSVVASAVALAVTIADMAVVRDMVRRLTLVPYFSPSDLTVHPQMAVTVAFLVLLLAGVATVAWMVGKLAGGAGETGQ